MAKLLSTAHKRTGPFLHLPSASCWFFWPARLSPIFSTCPDHLSLYHCQLHTDHRKILTNLGSQKLMGILKRVIILTNKSEVCPIQPNRNIVTAQTTEIFYLVSSSVKPSRHTPCVCKHVLADWEPHNHQDIPSQKVNFTNSKSIGALFSCKTNMDLSWNSI